MSVWKLIGWLVVKQVLTWKVHLRVGNHLPKVSLMKSVRHNSGLLSSYVTNCKL